MRLLLVLTAAAAALLSVASGGHAAVETLVFRSAGISIKPYFTAEGIMPVPSPTVDGYVTGMSVRLVDATGNDVPDEDVMLHHVVFGNAFHQDALCSAYRGFRGVRLPYAPERFYGAGEEGFRLSLPPGYGYPNAADDRWGIVYMLMNHHAQEQTVYVEYTVRYDTSNQLTPVKPLWLDERNCVADPVWDVPGTGGKGATASRSVNVRIPVAGRIVAAGGHLHGGGISLRLSDTSCDRTLFTSRPTWGHREPKPVLHEAGPSHMSSFSTSVGIPVAAGDILRLTATYDNGLPHTRVMGIMLAYLALEPVSGCGAVPPLDVDLGSPGPPPLQPMPLPRRPIGSLTSVRTAWLSDFRFSSERVAVSRGTRFTWRFAGPTEHNVTLASGPVGFSSPTLLSGRFSYRFTRPGLYRFYCSLHPVAMVQTITVRR